jgi:hypothetical protein
MSRKTITDAVEAVGAALFTVGVAAIYVPAGVMVAGVLLVLGAYLAGDE